MLKIKYWFIFRTTVLALFFMFFFINNVFAVVDNINKITFTTDPQIINTSEVSKEINVQAQNISNIGEKMDVSGAKLSLFSSSLSGEFSASLTKWEKITTPLTVNSNWTGRTFYYKNSTEGIDTITATLLVGGKSWIATQDITVGSSSGGGGITPPIIDPITSTTTATTTDSTSTSTIATTTVVTKIINHYSVHYISEELSDYVEEESLKLSAGRERIAYVGTPLIFTAKNNKTDKNVDFTWSFGDATESKGVETTHIYKYPGEYFVVLNGVYGSEKAVSRTSIKVLEPKISLSINSNNMEIENGGENEINIGGWKIKSSQSEFIIPNDTIIGSKNKIILSMGDIGFLPGLKDFIKIEDQSINMIAFIQKSSESLAVKEDDSSGIISKNISDLENILGIKIEEAEKIVLNYKKDIAVTHPKEQGLNVGLIPKDHVSVGSQIENGNVWEKEINVATVDEAVNSTTSIGFWKKLVRLPISSIRAISEVFYDL
ncbi:MAG: PKD domain-containing protein [Candidatus Paceibacterota bacterium]